MNKCLFTGRVSKDPELKYVGADNKAVCTSSIAVPRRFNRDEADFYIIKAWGKQAEFLQKYFKKGQQIAVVGAMQNVKYKDKNGNEVRSVELIVDELDFMGSKQDNQGASTTAQSASVPSDDSGFYPIDMGNLSDEEMPF
jgi:single-strand DNA-binding protein